MRSHWTPLRVVFGIDLRTLALFRINLALLLIADLVLRARDLTAHYTDRGVLPRTALLGEFDAWRPSIHLLSGSTTLEAILFIAAGLVALAMLVGYRTRVAAIVSWVFLISLQHRNPLISQGGDVLLRVLLFWAMFLPLGARFSIDSALQRTNEVSTKTSYFSAATCALLVQCMCVYLFTAILKNDPAWIPDGTAVAYAARLEMLTTPIGHWLGGAPSMLIHALTYFVWVLEVFAAFLMFMPLWNSVLRLTAMALLIMMHVGFLLTLKIGLFPLISITSILVFLPGRVWDWLGQRAVRDGGTRTSAIYYDAGCDFCRKICHLLRTLLMVPKVSISPAQDFAAMKALMEKHNSWIVVDGAGATHLRWVALAHLIDSSPLFWPLARPIAALGNRGDRIYGWVAARRSSFSSITARWLQWREPAGKPTIMANLVVVGLLALVLRSNFSSIGIDVPVPDAAIGIERTLRLSQRWDMFAPLPARADTWIVAVAELANGMVIDPRFDELRDPSWSKPDLTGRAYANYRWRKYLTGVVRSKNSVALNHYAQFLCRRWNDANFEEFDIARLQLSLVSERTDVSQPKDQSMQESVLWDGSCDSTREEPDTESITGDV